jgi:tRNA U34 5-methylaminomethyl-2-thiouridine-forming methyltransferase MnmC
LGSVLLAKKFRYRSTAVAGIAVLLISRTLYSLSHLPESQTDLSADTVHMLAIIIGAGLQFLTRRKTAGEHFSSMKCNSGGRSSG